MQVTAVDLATYSELLAHCYIATDGADVDHDELSEVLAELAALPGRRGYFTRTFCEQSRYVQPPNGERIDAIRDHLEDRYRGTPLYPVLLTSLLLAADRVDSTTGLQMAYLKSWSRRSYRPLELRAPELLAGPGLAVRGDATEIVDLLPPVDLVYLDPPYNQHRYFTNYHVWETLVRWDEPDHYGVACKRVDSRDPQTRSVFNSRRTMPTAFLDLIDRVRGQIVMVSYNDESWVDVAEISAALGRRHDKVVVLDFDSPRYVGARIGIHSPAGLRVGTPGRLRNREFVFVAGTRERVEAVEELVGHPGWRPTSVATG
ncbi:MAG: DNA adenine methylase [Candidatus Nanopelagicales bacterium]